MSATTTNLQAAPTVRTALVVHLEINPGKVEEFLAIARAHATNSQNIESGCLRFDVLRSSENNDHIVLVEVYADDRALEQHLCSEHMATYMQQVDGMIGDRRRYRCVL